MRESVHCELRNLLMMVLIPKPLHKDGQRQAAYLRATVSRVRLYLTYEFTSFIILKLLKIFVDCKPDSDAVKGT